MARGRSKHQRDLQGRHRQLRQQHGTYRHGDHREGRQWILATDRSQHLQRNNHHRGWQTDCERFPQWRFILLRERRRHPGWYRHHQRTCECAERRNDSRGRLSHFLQCCAETDGQPDGEQRCGGVPALQQRNQCAQQPHQRRWKTDTQQRHTAPEHGPGTGDTRRHRTQALLCHRFDQWQRIHQHRA